MKEQFRSQPPEVKTELKSTRDYTQSKDVVQAIERLVAGLKEDGDDYRMFNLLGVVLQQNPELLMPVIRGSLNLAKSQLGQDRQAGSSATLLYPVDAAIRVVAKRLQLLDTDPLSANSWNAQKIATVLEQYPREIVNLAGNNTTSKNLPQRAAHILWLLDQCPLIQPEQKISFMEIGSSGGLILDALQQPKKFQQWMQARGYRSDFALKSNSKMTNPTLGLDLVKPELDWLQAVILEDELRKETTEFIGDFARSRVITGNAIELDRLTEVNNFVTQNSADLPVIFSCFVFYQLDEAARNTVTNQARSLLKQQGGGLLLISDIAKYRGFPEKAGGCVSWAEDQTGQQVTPKIMLSKSTLTEWKEI